MPVSTILDLVGPKYVACFAIFCAFADTVTGTQFYDVHDVSLLRNPDSILAYEMNGAPLPLLHGAPLRLRNESELGFKQVKWIQSIELARGYGDRFQGEGGFREDHEFIARNAEI